MNRKKNLIFFLVFILLVNCSFDNKTGIWSGEEKEKGRITELEKEQNQIIDIVNVYSSESIYSKEASLTKNISISNPKKNLSWKMSSFNHQNFLGNIYLSGIDNIYGESGIGKILKFMIPGEEVYWLSLTVYRMLSIPLKSDKGV